MRHLIAALLLCLSSCVLAESNEHAAISCYNGSALVYQGCAYHIDAENSGLIFTECDTHAIIYMFDPMCIVKWSDKHASAKREKERGKKYQD